MIALWRYRRYILRNAIDDLRHRYTGTALGVFWNVVSPLVQILVYAVVFTRLMKVQLSPDASPGLFMLYMCSGLLPWIAFSDCVTRGMNSLVDNAAYLKKLPIPESVFVAQAALSSAISLGITLLLLVLVALVAGQRPSVWWLAMFPIALLWQALGFGLGLLLGGLNAFIRDVSQIVNVLLQIWMWTVPIIYLESILPEGFRRWLWLNPPYPFVKAMHQAVVYGQNPPGATWWAMLAWAVGSVGVGLLMLRGLAAEIRDVL